MQLGDEKTQLMEINLFLLCKNNIKVLEIKQKQAVWKWVIGKKKNFNLDFGNKKTWKIA